MDWIEWSGTFEEFQEQRLNKPGILVENDVGEQYLIGHINVAADFGDENYVEQDGTVGNIVRYKRVWSINP